MVSLNARAATRPNVAVTKEVNLSMNSILTCCFSFFPF